MSEATTTIKKRIGRTTRTQARVKAAASRPLLTVFRSNQHIYAQVVDHTGKVLAQSSDMKLDKKLTNTELAIKVGAEVGKAAVTAGVKEVSFNRGGYRYHGRVKALADAAREAGLVF